MDGITKYAVPTKFSDGVAVHRHMLEGSRVLHDARRNRKGAYKMYAMYVYIACIRR